MDEQDEADHPTETRPAGVEDEDSPQPEVARIRRKVHSAGRDGRVRSKTIAPKRLTRDERRLSELLVYPDDVDRPKMREHCSQMARPCPFVSCSHHLYLDVNPETGSIKLAGSISLMPGVISRTWEYWSLRLQAAGGMPPARRAKKTVRGGKSKARRR